MCIYFVLMHNSVLNAIRNRGAGTHRHRKHTKKHMQFVIHHNLCIQYNASKYNRIKFWCVQCANGQFSGRNMLFPRKDFVNLNWFCGVCALLVFSMQSSRAHGSQYMPLAFFETKHLLASIQTHEYFTTPTQRKNCSIVCRFETYNVYFLCEPMWIPFFNCTHNLGYKNNHCLQKLILQPLKKDKKDKKDKHS